MKAMTIAVPFSAMPFNDSDEGPATHLFFVSPGIAADQALAEADRLYENVQQTLDKGGIDDDVASLCAFAMDAANAIRKAAGAHS